MPRIRRRRRRRRTDGLTKAERSQLLYGSWWFQKEPIPHEERRALWEERRDELMGEWIQEEPGTRPWAWWEFDAPERRRRIDGKPHPFDNPTREAEIRERAAENPEPVHDATCLWYGCPRFMIVLPGRDMDDFEAVYESQREYLDRLGLLTADERGFSDV